MEPQALAELLRERMPGYEIDVSGDGRHFEVILIGEGFEGLRTLKRQQLVYAALAQEIADGTVHAVQMRTLTPAEAEARG